MSRSASRDHTRRAARAANQRWVFVGPSGLLLRTIPGVQTWTEIPAAPSAFAGQKRSSELPPGVMALGQPRR